MPEQKQQELLIIKRSRDSAHPHHGGAWKIAFADFMTAMMALFLVLWLINATNQKTKASLARYFNPVDLVDMSTLQRGVRDPSDSIVTDGATSKQNPTNPTSQQSKDGKAFPDGGGALQKGNSKKAVPGNAHAVQTDSLPSSADTHTSDQYVAPAERQPTYAETALFRDPYAVLAKIAASSDDAGGGKSGSSSSGDADGASTTSFKDPFKNTMPNTLANDAAAPAPPRAAAKSNPAAAPTVLVAQPSAVGSLAATANQAPQSVPTSAAPLVQQSDATRSKSASTAAHSGAVDAAKTQEGPQGADDLQQLKQQIAGLVGTAGKGEGKPNIDVKITKEGVLIRLMDESNYAMFAIGSAEPEPKTVRLMEKIARILKSQKGMIVISGHTDGRPYKSATYDNWRLSSARAQMAYYMLVRGGLDAKRIERIEGYADRDLKEPKNPLADDNRRIEIFLRTGTS